MFDTMTMTKVVGAFCGTLLVLLLGGWVAEIIYHPGGGHGDEHAQAYSIEVPETGAAGAAAAEETGPPFEEIYAVADAAAGEELWRNCRACHALEPGVNGTGPTLHGVVGREVAAVEGFNYSGALRDVVEVWTPEELDGFLADPRGYAPGTAMTYGGMRRAEDRADLIAYLATFEG
ncbi:cytochrome c552 [Oceanicola granulosus HTCC2516]|uniref:Cytochrome c552 n=1 Tax=Oceanicola granulosus (strain ATCC BAA-861 / DSM 15982 / KCTC 12143 / HTCC2516) TaxID=314256 RepID=Q2CDL8_OCEGH|nr:cytochrome c family protein [Oceanicola granulosus]EAR50832.1 cytochrome c552 [Oceanicola granulosus HTCC2516]